MESVIQMQSSPAIASNPFSTRFIRPGAIPFVFPAGVSQPSLLNDFERFGRWCQIIGNHGSGKSTLLHSLRPELERVYGVQWAQVSPDTGRIQWIGSSSKALKRSEPAICVIDGFDRLGWLSRWRVMNACS